MMLFCIRKWKKGLLLYFDKKLPAVPHLYLFLTETVVLFLKVQLYEDFAKSRAKKSLDDDLTEVQAQMEKLTTNRSHIFQVVPYELTEAYWSAVYISNAIAIAWVKFSINWDLIVNMQTKVGLNSRSKRSVHL